MWIITTAQSGDELMFVSGLETHRLLNLSEMIIMFTYFYSTSQVLIFLSVL
jgi:hypothetical protein